MAFWGVEVKPGKPFTLKVTEPRGMKRLHLSQATLGLGNATLRCVLQCNVGTKIPVFLCVLQPEKVDSCQLNVEFEEADDVIFSVIGPRSIHLTGFFLGRPNSVRLNNDESESYGEDIVDSDMEKASSDDYDYNDSFINDSDPSRREDDVEMSIKELAAKRGDKKKNGKGRRRLRKKFQVSDSESDETSARPDDSSNGDSMTEMAAKTKVLSSEVPLPSRVTRSRARSSSLEIVEPEPNAKFEKASKVTSPLEKREDKPVGDVELSPVEKSFETLSKKARNKESVVVIDGKGKDMPESLEDEKPAADKGTKSSSDVLPSQNGDATPSKKKRKRDRREETTDVKKNIFESLEVKKKQAIDKNILEEADTKKKPLEPEITSNEVIIEEIEKGKLDGKLAVKGRKASILYTARLKDTGKLFASNLGEAPLRFRLDGKKVIKGLSIGVEGMRVGDKRRLIIPPSLGFSEEGLKDDVPKNAWLVYEVEAVKIR